MVSHGILANVTRTHAKIPTTASIVNGSITAFIISCVIFPLQLFHFVQSCFHYIQQTF